VVTLRDEAGCSFREIAAALGIPENTAVTVYYRYVNGRRGHLERHQALRAATECHRCSPNGLQSPRTR
jgi:DNA-directed RNA polymerase specialized sigma24 family protein